MKDNSMFLGLRDPKAPVDALCDNVIASRMGEACRLAAKKPGGDLIDRGLELLKQMNEHGFDVLVKLPERVSDTQ